MADTTSQNPRVAPPRRPEQLVTHRLASAALAALILAAPAARAAEPPRTAPGTRGMSIEEQAARAVSVSLRAEHAPLQPGGSTTLALSFDLAEGWHLYWRNPGDSGAAIGFDFQLPQGVTIGQPQWPTPKRSVAPGDILDYIYEKRVTLLFPLTVAPSVTGPINIRAKIDWLVCREACVPGERAVELTIPIAQSSAPSTAAADIAAARAAMPAPLRDAAPSERITAVFQDMALRIHAPAASSLAFYPYEDELQPDNPLDQGAAQGDSLTLAYSAAAPSDRIRGLLVVSRPTGSHAYLLDVSAGTNTSNQGQ
ncbi:MAG: protein-disulfide reductase DsbD N-terminal domain-containing protein [Planctomycetota bacterium]|nr:protein-disulfide reductase DsbD N-terminal domain-containing protein [Planctomycetota bacterium]